MNKVLPIGLVALFISVLMMSFIDNNKAKATIPNAQASYWFSVNEDEEPTDQIPPPDCPKLEEPDCAKLYLAADVEQDPTTGELRVIQGHETNFIDYRSLQ